MIHRCEYCSTEYDTVMHWHCPSAECVARRAGRPSAIRLHVTVSAAGFSKTTIWYKTLKGAQSAAHFWTGEAPWIEKDPTGRYVATGKSHLGTTSVWVEGTTWKNVWPQGVEL